MLLTYFHIITADDACSKSLSTIFVVCLSHGNEHTKVILTSFIIIHGNDNILFLLNTGNITVYLPFPAA